MGIKIKNLQTGEFEKFNIPALKGEKGEPGEIEPSEKVDYIGKQHSKLRDTMNANVDYIIKTAIGEFNYLDYEGQHITATNSIEGHAKSAILSGQTLVNLSFPHDEREIIFNDRYQVYNVTNNIAKGGLKNGEKIFMSMEVNIHEVNIETPLFRAGTCRETGGYDNITITNAEICNLPKNTWVRLYAIREVKEVESSEQYSFWFGMRGEHPTTEGEQIARVSFRNPVWINLTSMFGKGKEPALSECEKLPYFTGMQSVKMPVLTTTGSNMVNPADIEVIGCNSYDVDSDGIINVVGDTTGYWAKSFIRYTHHLKGNTTYYIYCDGDSTGTINAEGWVGNINAGKISWNNFYKYTPETDVLYVAKIFLNTDASPFTCSKIRIGIFESTTKPSSFEPYKSNILTANEEVELRGIGDVKDTLDLMTGELTERIGEIVLDGSENWFRYDGYAIDGYTAFITTIPSLNNLYYGSLSFISADFPTGTWHDYAGAVKTEFVWNHDPNMIGIRVKNEKASNVEEIKEFLSTNNIRINYQLAQESIKTVDLSDNHVYSYGSTTHYSCSSEEGSLVPTLSVKVPTDTQLTIQEQKATTQTLLIKNMDLQQSIKEVQAMNLAFNTALYNSFNSIREEVEDIKKHVSTNENLEGSF